MRPPTGTGQKRTTATSRLLDAAGDPTPAKLAEVATDPFTASRFGDDLPIPQPPDPPHLLSIRGTCEMLPRRENRVTLDSVKTDNHGRPAPSIHLSNGPHARRTAAECRQLQVSIMDELCAEVIDVSSLDGRQMGSHHIGTTRMGTDPSTSVVDETGRTHDLANLWIASSSVFPTAAARNPTLTIVALALRTAEHIDAEL